MLPDFPDLKESAERELMRHVERRVPEIAPLLAKVGRFTVHEGALGRLQRADHSVGEIGFDQVEFEFALTRDEMRSSDPAALLQKLEQLATEFAERQSHMLFARVNEAVEQTGNVLALKGGELTPDHLLEMVRRMDLTFDESTGQLSDGFSFVIPAGNHALRQKLAEWDKDPDVRARWEAMLAQKREEWRDREARRTLVD
jgi:hypothetical protein